MRAGTAQREANRVAWRHPTRLIGVLTVAFGIGQVACIAGAGRTRPRRAGDGACHGASPLAAAAGRWGVRDGLIPLAPIGSRLDHEPFTVVFGTPATSASKRLFHSPRLVTLSA
ncbi:hypothetical protein GCM10009126_05820 [Rhodanobacter caeni]|uniref:Uncharacterized protein n=1 Tax=Rhodanobacter caeni TaxID=657654 RepID=A0ABP3DXT3_9GAMM